MQWADLQHSLPSMPLSLSSAQVMTRGQWKVARIKLEHLNNSKDAERNRLGRNTVCCMLNSSTYQTSFRGSYSQTHTWVHQLYNDNQACTQIVLTVQTTNPKILKSVPVYSFPCLPQCLQNVPEFYQQAQCIACLQWCQCINNTGVGDIPWKLARLAMGQRING